MILSNPSRVRNPLTRRMEMLCHGTGPSGAGEPTFTPPLQAVSSKVLVAFGLGCLLEGMAESTRVRRSSDSAEQDVGSLADGEYDDASFTSFVGGGTGYATTLYDHKGSDDVVQTTAAAQPVISLTGLGGKAAVVFAGAEWLSTAASVTGSNFGTGDFEVWFVVRPTTLSGGDIAIGARGNYSPEFYTRAGAVNKPAMYIGSYARFDTVLSTSTDYLLRFYRHSGVLYCDVNGVQEATTHAWTNDYSVTARITVGADSPAGNDKAKSNIGFNVWFKQALTSGEASTLAAALMDFWGIA